MLILAAGLYGYWLFSILTKPMPAHAPSGMDFASQSEAVLVANNPCEGSMTPLVTRTIFIAESQQAVRPDVIDVHYTCGPNGQERAFLWEPGQP